MRVRITIISLLMLGVLVLIGLLAWFEGWPLASRVAWLIFPCFAIIAGVIWFVLGSTLSDLARSSTQRIEPSKPELDAQPAPESIEASDEIAPATTTSMQVNDDPSSQLAANSSRVMALDMKQEVHEHVEAIRSMGTSINRRTQDPAIVQASQLIIEAADRIDLSIDEVLRRNDSGAQSSESLSDSIVQFIELCRQRVPATRFTVRLGADIDSLDVQIATAAQAISQAAVENSIAHAGASHVELNCRRVENDLVVQVADNGVGLPVSGALSAGGGLRSIRERARVVGGDIELGKSRLGGVAVRANLPIDVAAPESKVVNG